MYNILLSVQESTHYDYRLRRCERVGTVVMQSFEIVLKKRKGGRRLPPYPLFAKFNLFFGLGVLFAGVGVGLEIADYSQRYAPDRTHDNLAELNCTETLRYPSSLLLCFRSYLPLDQGKGAYQLA